MNELTRARLCELIDRSPGMVLVLEQASGQIAYANQWACHALGFNRAQLHQLTVSALDPIGLTRDCLCRLRASHPNCLGTYRHRDGAIVPVWVNASQVPTAEGPFLVVSLREFLQGDDRLLLDPLPMPFCCYLPDTTLLYVNPAYAALFGTTPEALRGWRWLDGLPAAERTDARAALASLTPAQPTRVHENTLETPDGPRWTRWLNRAAFDEAGAIRYLIGIGEDVTAQRMAEHQRNRLQAELRYQTTHDPLTGLANRQHFEARLDQALDQAQAAGGQLAVGALDLDGFQQINDGLGPRVGDEVLQAVAGRLQAQLRAADCLARASGDEFLFLLPEAPAARQAARVAERLLATFQAPFGVAGQTLRLSACLGISCYPDDATQGEALITQAEAALRQAKARGRRRCLFAHAAHPSTGEQLHLEQALGELLEREELTVAYQPIVDLASGHVRGAEALARWEHPEWGAIPPDRFIPVAEAAELIRPLGERVLRTACAQAATWRAAGYPLDRVAVNVSGHQLQDPAFPATVARILCETELSAEALELEVTEVILTPDADEAAAGVVQTSLTALRQSSVTLAVDDFGTGYAALTRLQWVPCDQLKIDKAFVAELTHPGPNTALVEAILALSQKLGITVVAEGIETEDQWIQLRALGCPEGQGFLFGRPQPAEQFIHQATARGFCPGSSC